MDQTENNFINNTNTTTPAPQNITLEFYFTSPDEYPNDNAYDVSSISPIQQPVDYQQDTPPQQSFETIIVQPTFQEYLDDNTYDTTSIPPNSFENT
ncbi:unnamed protein product [Rhizophagus irregularis]|nr:unnamed protein product [Rhizophagus irregularis]